VNTKTNQPEILSTIPRSGSVDEVRFDASGDCLWVKFQDSDFSDWVGVFGPGWGGGDDAQQNVSGIAFVVSNGQGYVVDVYSRALLSKTACDYLKRVVSCSNNMFVAATNTDIRVYDSKKLVFCTERVASDGIEFDTYGDSTVKGKVWGFDSWYSFTLNIVTQKYECNWAYPL